MAAPPLVMSMPGNQSQDKTQVPLDSHESQGHPTTTTMVPDAGEAAQGRDHSHEAVVGMGEDPREGEGEVERGGVSSSSHDPRQQSGKYDIGLWVDASWVNQSVAGHSWIAVNGWKRGSSSSDMWVLCWDILCQQAKTTRMMRSGTCQVKVAERGQRRSRRMGTMAA